MENQYTSRFVMDFGSGHVEINLQGDDQNICFKFMLGFISIPSFLNKLFRLWDAETCRAETNLI